MAKGGRNDDIGLLTLAVAAGIYWWLPDWRIKKKRMRSLKDRNSPELIGYLDDLRRKAGLSRLPSFFWGVLDQTKEAYAFGRWGHLCVYLPDGLVNSFEENRAEFRAALLHEFAHIYNGDVHRTYLSFTVWWAFLITALPTFFITLLRSPLERMFGMSGRVVILFLLIYLMRNSVLRAREFYADLRASIWDSQSSALRLALESAERSSEKLSFWQRIWVTHPDLGDRQRILDDPNPLLRMGFWDAFATGMATMIPFTNFVALAILLASIGPSSDFMLIQLPFFVPALISATLIIYIIGAGTWRMTFAALAFGKPVRGINTLGAGLALGIVAGQQLSFLGASKFLSSPLILLFWGGLLLISLTSFFQWISVGAMTWLPIAVTSRSPRIFYRSGLVISGCILANIFVGMFTILIALIGRFSFHRSIAFNPFISLGLIGLWAYPMSSWFWRKHKQIGDLPASEWLFLDSQSQPIVLSQQSQLKPTLALIVGLVGGIIGYLFVSIIVALGGNILEFIFALSIFIQVLVAGFVAVWMRHLGSIHGLLSASIAACITSSTVFTHTSLNLADALFIVTGVFNSGGLVAVPTVLIASLIVSLFRDSKRFKAKGVGH
jgi:Zn-dependent protease with chaperone function